MNISCWFMGDSFFLSIKIISPLDTSLEFVRGVGKSGFVVFYVLCTVFFNML